MEWVPRAGSKFLVGGGGAGSKCGCLIKVGKLNPPVTLESSGELLFKAPVLTLFPPRVLFNWFDWDQPSDLKLKASQVIPARPQGWVYCRKKKKKLKLGKLGLKTSKSSFHVWHDVILTSYLVSSWCWGAFWCWPPLPPHIFLQQSPLAGPPEESLWKGSGCYSYPWVPGVLVYLAPFEICCLKVLSTLREREREGGERQIEISGSIPACNRSNNLMAAHHRVYILFFCKVNLSWNLRCPSPLSFSGSLSALSFFLAPLRADV